jgi:hypothetical protein
MTMMSSSPTELPPIIMALPRTGENKAIIYSLCFRFLVSKIGRRADYFAFMFHHGFEVYLALQPALAILNVV